MHAPIKVGMRTQRTPIVRQTQEQYGGSRRRYIWRNNKLVAIYFRDLDYSQSLHRFVMPFLTFMVDLTFGKILNIREESQ